MQPEDIKAKEEKLRQILSDMGSVLIAYSGGVDSTYLLKVAFDVLGKKVLAVTARSETYTASEYRQAVDYITGLGASHLVIDTQELGNEAFACNPTDRCYYCKSELFGKLRQTAQERGIAHIADGTNTDDVQHDFRPGLRASREKEVRHPLYEAGMSKEDIRQASRALDLPTWDQPAAACLASRFPYGQKITPEKLTMIDRAEEFLRSEGFRTVRVRHHDTIARIEVEAAELPRLAADPVRTRVAGRLKEIGYTYVTVDLQGFRSGSMNEVLPDAEKTNISV